MLINFHYSYIPSGFANAGTLTIFLSVLRGKVMTLSFVRRPERESGGCSAWLGGESPGVKRHWKSSGTLTICRFSQDSETWKIQFSPWVTLYNLSLSLNPPTSTPQSSVFLYLFLSLSLTQTHTDTHTY